MTGLGISMLLGNFVIRSDFGYFVTNDQINNKKELYREYDAGKQIIIESCEDQNVLVTPWSTPIDDCENEPVHKETFLLDNFAKYYQFVLEIEYAPSSDVNIISQLSKYNPTDYGIADSLTLSTTILMDPELFFIPGMGSPNFFISNSSLSLIG